MSGKVKLSLVEIAPSLRFDEAVYALEFRDANGEAYKVLITGYRLRELHFLIDNIITTHLMGSDPTTPA